MVAHMKIKFEFEEPDVNDVPFIIGNLLTPPDHKHHHTSHHHDEDYGNDGCYGFLDILGKALVDFIGHLFD